MMFLIWFSCYLINTVLITTVLANKPPRFSQTILVVQTLEETRNGTVIALVSATDPDNDRILYQLGADANGKFRIGKNTGVIFLNQKLDREQLGKENSLEFTVYASDVRAPLKRSSMKVVVYVGDINDNSPTFVGLPYIANITEDTDVDSFIFKVSATDADQNNEILYYITDGNEDDTFKIDHYRGVIRTRKTLDYEKKQFYRLNISVMDARPKDPVKHMSYTIMTIGIEDVDDNGAAFESTNYSAHVREGQLAGTYITRVHAIDLDRGLNAPVRYSLNEDTDPQSLFTVDDKSGVVTTIGTLDRETKARYSLEIFATSTYHPPTKTVLIVYVDDINDNGPTFDKNTYRAEILENTPVGSTVLQVAATDPDVMGSDQSTQPRLHYDIWGKDTTFGITSEGNIFINETIDRERKDIFNFKVIAREDGKPPSSALVTIRILDDNDNTPLFRREFYSASVKENRIPGKHLIKVSATDDDSGVNGLVIYSIFPDAEGLSSQFQVEPITGWIKANDRLDREKVETYSLLVKASDNAKDLEKRRFSTVRVNIQVLDENDNAPVMEKSKEECNIFQDSWMNTQIVAVKATDADAGDFGTVTYSIAKGNEQKLFRVDQQSGHIKIAASLMPYAGKTFTLIVGAIDNHGRDPFHVTSKNTTVFIKIYESDNAVLFVSGRSKMDMTKNAEDFRRDLQRLVGLGISIHQISNSDIGKGCNIIFHSFNQSTEDVIDRLVVLRILTEINPRHKDTFLSKWNITEWKVPLPSTLLSTGLTREGDTKQTMNIIIYIIIVVCSVIAIGGGAGIYYAMKIKRRYYEESSLAAESILQYRCDNNSYWCSSDEDFEHLSQRRTLTSELPDLIEMYGDETLGDNNGEIELVYGMKRPSRNDSRASSIPFANSSCGTIYRAPSSCSTSSQLQMSRKGSRASRRHRRKTMGGGISKSEPQLMIKRLSIVLDTTDPFTEFRCYRHAKSKRYRLGIQQGTC